MIVHISCLLDRNTMLSFAMLGRRICKLGLERRASNGCVAMDAAAVAALKIADGTKEHVCIKE
jgi:hypothetical protein